MAADWITRKTVKRQTKNIMFYFAEMMVRFLVTLQRIIEFTAGNDRRIFHQSVWDARERIFHRALSALKRFTRFHSRDIKSLPFHFTPAANPTSQAYIEPRRNETRRELPRDGANVPRGLHSDATGDLKTLVIKFSTHQSARVNISRFLKPQPLPPHENKLSWGIYNRDSLFLPDFHYSDHFFLFSTMDY